MINNNFTFNDSCPVCNKVDKKQLFEINDYSIVQCKNCSLKYLYPLPEEKSIREIYQADYFSSTTDERGYKNYIFDEPLVKRTYKKRLLKVKNILRFEKDNVFRAHEAGCAYGFGLQIIQSIFPNCSLTASDISKEAVNFCNKKGYEVYLSDLWGRTKELDLNSLDLLIMFDVIEHFRNIQPFVYWASKVIKKGGFVILTTPDINSFFNRILGKRSPSYKIPEHIIYFSKETLSFAFRESFNLIRSFSDYQIIRLDRMVTKIFRLLKLPINLVDRAKILRLFNIWTPNGMRIYVFQKK